MKKHPWFPFLIADYEHDTQDLTLAEHGAYLKLLLFYYSRREPLPDDLTRLLRVCAARGRYEIAAVKKIAQRFFLPKDGRLYNKMADTQLCHQNEISLIKSTNARSIRSHNHNHSNTKESGKSSGSTHHSAANTARQTSLSLFSQNGNSNGQDAFVSREPQRKLSRREERWINNLTNAARACEGVDWDAHANGSRRKH
jgi:uncharacterized protein YdaU (DUF1376 family)